MRPSYTSGLLFWRTVIRFNEVSSKFNLFLRIGIWVFGNEDRLSVSVKWLAVKTASKMTYTVSGGVLNSAQPSTPSEMKTNITFDWW